MTPWIRDRFGDYDLARGAWFASVDNLSFGWQCLVRLLNDDDEVRISWGVYDHDTPEQARAALVMAMPQWALDAFPEIREPIPGGDVARQGPLFVFQLPKGGDQ